MWEHLTNEGMFETAVTGRTPWPGLEARLKRSVLDIQAAKLPQSQEGIPDSASGKPRTSPAAALACSLILDEALQRL